ncbi:MAG: monomethylamine:corrinoid methyltransferase [Candidatus Bathyarchaeia archaeon]
MHSFLDVLEKAESGPICEEKEWNMKLLPKKVSEKVKEYDIKFDREMLIPNDDDLIDNVFKAGFELALELGILCTSTERRIIFSEEELKTAIREAPFECVLGRGPDKVIMKRRMPEEPSFIFNFIGPLGTPVSEELFIPVCYSYMKERVIDGITGPTLAKIYGREIMAGTPMEVLAAKMDMRLLRESASRANRKWMPVQVVETSLTAIGYISGCSVNVGAFPEDMHLTPLISELKTNYDQLAKVAHSLSMNANINGYTHPMIGGYVGGPEGSAITTVAACLLSRATHFSNMPGHFAHDVRYQANTSRESIWAESLSHQAISRNTHILVGGGSSPCAGPCTEMLLYETAATSIANVISGSAWLCGVRSATGIYENYCSGLEGKFAGELTRAFAKSGFKRSDTNELIKKLVKYYEDKLRNPPKGMAFQECYDVKACEPSLEWAEIYKKIKKELIDLGVRFDIID